MDRAHGKAEVSLVGIIGGRAVLRIHGARSRANLSGGLAERWYIIAPAVSLFKGATPPP